jgi:hypothetical protein
MNTSQDSFINSDDDIDVQEFYNDYEFTFNAYIKAHSKLKDVMHDKESLTNELSESHVLIDSLKSEKESLANDLSKSQNLIDSLKSEISVLVEKSVSLENELNVSKELSRNSSSDNLKSFLCIEESVSNKLSMIVDNTGASTSHVSNESLNVERVNVKEAKADFSKTPSVKQTQGKFVPICHHCGVIGHIRPNCWKFKAAPKKENPAVSPTRQGKKGKKKSIVPHASYPKPRVVHPPRKLPSQRFVPTCHHCGKVGHIRPHCFNLKPHVQKNKNSVSRKDCEGLVMMMKGVLSRLDQFEKVHKPRPKITQVWVRKDDTIHPLRGSGNELTLF